jgi:UDP-N-acetyl-D-mannosaminuronic acid dehydrogenase
VAKTLPAVLHLKTEEVDTPEKRGKYRVSIIGSGQQGIFYALAFAEAGFKVTCTDADQSAVKRLAKGNAQLADHEAELRLKRFLRAGQLSATSDLKTAVAQGDIIIISINATIDAKKNPDYSEIENACKQVGSALQKGSLVVYGGIAGFGFTDGLLREALENTSGLKVGEDFALAYNPTLNSQTGVDEWRIAAKDKVSLNSAAVLLETVAKREVKKISNAKTAELAVLFAIARREVNVALANEMAIFCENAGVDHFETLKIIEKSEAMHSSPTIAEEENRNGVYLLLEGAENIDSRLRLLLLARQLNENMTRHAVSLTQDSLRSFGRTLRRARIALLGSVRSGTGAAALVEMLEAKGVKVSRYDPQSSDNEQAESSSSLRRTLNETVEGTDCVVILTAQEQLRRLNLKKLRAVMRSPAALVDLVGMLEPSKVEEAGFIYRGLGRGVWKK